MEKISQKMVKSMDSLTNTAESVCLITSFFDVVC